MKLQKWTVVPTALGLALMSSVAALSAPVQTPLSAPVIVTGTSESSQASQCGFLPATPTQIVRVTEAFTSLRFSVRGGSETTLLISGPGGRNQCVMADSFSGGNIEVPGAWEQGTYSIFVGDRAQGSHPFTLSITPEN
jgi:hypothetical protein